jgi:hypothetical protein
VLDDLGFASDHEAVAALKAPHATARPAIDQVDTTVEQIGGAADVVSVVGVSAVDDRVSLLHVER